VRLGLEFNYTDTLLHYLMLSVIPFIAEATTDAFIASSFFNMPYDIGFTLGFLLAGIGPASLYSALLSTRMDGHGARKQIPIKILSASSLENILCFLAYGISSSVTVEKY
jgi:hypothetical protein